jgi:hypothetical protein
MKLLTQTKIAAALALLMTATTTLADTMTQTQGFWLGYGSTYPSHRTLSFSGFDPSLGNLQSIGVSLSSTLGYYRSSPGWALGSAGVYQGSGSSMQILTDGQSNRDDTLNWNSQSPTMQMPISSTSTHTNADILSHFIGTGSADLTVWYQLNLQENGVYLPSEDSYSFGNVALSYSYDPTPEPPPAAVPESGSIAFLGIGITGLVVYGGRRKKAEQGSPSDS